MDGPLSYDTVVDRIVNREQYSLDSVKKIHGMSPYLYSYLLKSDPQKIDQYQKAKKKTAVSYFVTV